MACVQACPCLGMSHLDGLGRLASCLHVIDHVKMCVCVCVPYQQQVRVILHVLLVTMVLLYQWQVRT